MGRLPAEAPHCSSRRKPSRDLSLSDTDRRRRHSERNLVALDPEARLRVALTYPAVYAVGMGNLGLHTVYRLLNARPDVCCERVFLPGPEEIERLGRARASLATMETGRSVAAADALAFSASFENDYPNVLTILDLAGIALRAANRDDRDPLIVMGGATVSINPEPVAEFIDVFCLGEGEELVDPLVEALLSTDSRDETLERLARTPGFYVPRFYRPLYEGAAPARYTGIEARGPAPDFVTKVRAAFTGPDHVASTAILAPEAQFGDRALVEVARGCTKGCRYCWVGYNILPFRVHEVDDVLTAMEPWRPHTDRVGLVATALLDHPQIEAIADGLRRQGFRTFSPSLIVSTLRKPLLEAVIGSGQKTITIAPESGSDRLRELVNKKITTAEILEKVRIIFRAGALNLKNYIIIGLPGETKDDLRAIVDLGSAMRDIMVEECRHRGRIGTVTLSVNCLIPKPGTPLQWAPQITRREYRARLRWLQRRVARIPNLVLDSMPPRAAEIQGVLSRGDRRVADLLEEWHRDGNWAAALRRWQELGGPSLESLLAPPPVGDALPWGHLSIGPSPAALRTQWSRAAEIADRVPATTGSPR